MAHYIWLNPVVLSMYDPEQLKRELEERGYTIVVGEKNHVDAVKKQYQAAVEGCQGCVLDMRCPAAVTYVKEKFAGKQVDGEPLKTGQFEEERFVFPDIEPILIQTARELAGRLNLSDGSDLTVVTPCRELKELGEKAGMKSTHFLTWKEFAQKNGIQLSQRTLHSSPIPPGFFSEYGEDMVCLASKEDIDQFFESKQYRGKRIAEMLFCSQGCHSGNGVK